MSDLSRNHKNNKKNYKKNNNNNKKTVIEIKNAFDVLTGRLALTEERISGLKDLTV